MSQNGKGSAPRQQTPEQRRQYGENFDRIFRKRKKRPQLRTKPGKQP